MEFLSKYPKIKIRINKPRRLDKNKLEWLISNVTVKKESSVFQFLKEISSSQFRITLKVYFGQIFLDS